MAIQLQLSKETIPVEINGEVMFNIPVDDAFSIQFVKKAQEVETRALEALKSATDDESIDERLEKDMASQRMLVDSFLGEGAFDKLYELTGSAALVNDAFVDISIGYQQELTARRNAAEKKLKYHQRMQK